MHFFFLNLVHLHLSGTGETHAPPLQLAMLLLVQKLHLTSSGVARFAEVGGGKGVHQGAIIQAMLERPTPYRQGVGELLNFMLNRMFI